MLLGRIKSPSISNPCILEKLVTSMTVEHGESQPYFSSQFLSDAKTTQSYFLGPTSINFIMTILVRNIIFDLFLILEHIFNTFSAPLIGLILEDRDI